MVQVRRLIPNPTKAKDFSALLANQAPDRRKLSQVRGQSMTFTVVAPGVAQRSREGM